MGCAFKKVRKIYVGRADLEDGPEGLCEEGADALEAG